MMTHTMMLTVAARDYICCILVPTKAQFAMSRLQLCPFRDPCTPVTSFCHRAAFDIQSLEELAAILYRFVVVQALALAFRFELASVIQCRSFQIHFVNL